ncbi:MAG: SH3 domain-containing protein [Lachnospiraceae bacterium]
MNNSKDFKDKINDIKKHIKEYITDFKHLIKENKKIAIAAGAFFAVAIILIGIGSIMRQSKVASETIVAEAKETEGGSVQFVIPEEPLEVDAYPEVVNLVKQYFQAISDGDVTTIHQISNYLEDTEEIKIQKKSEFIEAHNNIKVYTKIGPVADSFIAYVYYELKFKEYELSAPGLKTLYICKNENGEYYINSAEIEGWEEEYLLAVSAQNDVVDLFNSIQVQYNETVENDEELRAFLESITGILTAAVGDELAKLEEASQAEEVAVVEEVPAEIEVVTKVKTTTVVNVRSSDSETADRLGKSEVGAVYDLIEERLNGWSKITFEGKDAFVKSEYLEPVETKMVSNPAAQTEASTTEEVVQEENSETETPVTENTTVEGKTGTVTAKESINVRISADQSSERIALCYAGDKLEVLENLSDGWSKVTYNGKTGYVKTEFLE